MMPELKPLAIIREYAEKMEAAAKNPHPVTGKANRIAECKADAARHLETLILRATRPDGGDSKLRAEAEQFIRATDLAHLGRAEHRLAVALLDWRDRFAAALAPAKTELDKALDDRRNFGIGIIKEGKYVPAQEYIADLQKNEEDKDG